MFAKNALINIGDTTQYQGLLGCTPPILRDFERPGLFSTPYAREIAVEQLVKTTAHKRLERAFISKSLSAEQLDLKLRDIVDIARKPATKDESGWRGPAKVVEVGTPLTIKWQNRALNVRAQDVRRAFVYLVFVMRASHAHDPYSCLLMFADNLSG